MYVPVCDWCPTTLTTIAIVQLATHVDLTDTHNHLYFKDKEFKDLFNSFGPRAGVLEYNRYICRSQNTLYFDTEFYLWDAEI